MVIYRLWIVEAMRVRAMWQNKGRRMARHRNQMQVEGDSALTLPSTS